MRNDVRLEGWKISAVGAADDRFLESVFFTGSGVLGARGYPALRPEPRPLDTGIFAAGMFDTISENTSLTDFVNLPTPIFLTLGHGVTAPAPCTQVRRELNLECGLLSFEYAVEGPNGRVDVRERRFFSLANPDLLFQRVELSDAAGLTLRAGIDCSSRNSPIPDDQVKENTETICMTRLVSASGGAGGISAAFETRHTGLGLDMEFKFLTGGLDFAAYEPEDGQLCARFTGRPGPAFIETASSIRLSRCLDPLAVSEIPENWSFDSALAAEREHWRTVWVERGVEIEGDPAAETAMRYVIYQLTVNCSARDPGVSIGARGLTHARYKGCYFWDTDLFLAPFYVLEDAEAARSLMCYRIGALPAAKEHAKHMNGSGARYPWMAALDGSEQCESWDIGASEVHVTADVAFALGNYLEWTGDDELFFSGGAALLIETARFWPSRYSPAPGGGVNLLFCKGPDEYCGITSNNLFTNVMVRRNLLLAARAAERLEREDPEQYAALGLSAGELRSWLELHEAIPIPRDPETGRLRQDDSLHLLEPVDPASLKAGDEASYHKVCFDRVQRYKVIKQADVLLLMTRLPELFTPEEKKAAWEDFEPLCLHDSSLSFATHALFAAQNGPADAAERYWEKALWLDLRDIMGNTGKEGLHLACLGETWQTLIFGFAGLHLTPNGPALAPHLPSKWRSLSFRFIHRGKSYEVRISRDESPELIAR